MPVIPYEEGLLDVGLQDKSQTVQAGQQQKDDAMFFECDLEARLDHATGRLDFRGLYVHGTPNARFFTLVGSARM